MQRGNSGVCSLRHRQKRFLGFVYGSVAVFVLSAGFRPCVAFSVIALFINACAVLPIRMRKYRHEKRGGSAEHSDATSLNEEFNAETAPGTGWRTRPVNAAQTCVPFPYGAGAQDQILEVRPCRQDLLAATERRDLLFCTARPGVRFHAGAAETYRFRPAPNRERVQSAGTEIIRMDSRTQRGFIDS